jgi:phosphoglycerate dehydrogenase-like enzyme
MTKIGKKRVLCLYPFTAETQAQLRAVSPELEITIAGPDTQAGVNAVEDPTLDALLANFAPSDIRRLPRLSWLGIIGAGVDHLRSGDPWQYGVTVTNGSGLHGTAIAEYTLAQILFVAQRISGRQQAQVDRAWPDAWTAGWLALLGTGLRNRTLTVVGYGSIGREIARLAHAFGMRVLAVKANPTVRGDRGYAPPGLGDPEGTIPARIAPISELNELFAASDVAVLTLPYTPLTERIIGAQAIRSLPRHALLINVARGKILDEEALGAALRDGALGGAVLDVASAEPIPPTSPLWQVPNLVLTPHVSAIQDPERWWDLVAGLMRENLARFADGRELLNIVDDAAGY